MRHSREGGNPYAPNFACLAETLEFMDPRLRGDDDMRERIDFFNSLLRQNGLKFAASLSCHYTQFQSIVPFDKIIYVSGRVSI